MAAAKVLFVLLALTAACTVGRGHVERQMSADGTSWKRKRPSGPTVIPLGAESTFDWLLSWLSYTPWSPWEPCSASCRTYRYRVCLEDGLMCDGDVQYQWGLCYTRGSPCHREVARRVRCLEKGRCGGVDLQEEEEEEEEEEAKEEKEGHPPASRGTGPPGGPLGECGRSRFPARVRRIIGGRRSKRGKWPWQVLLLSKEVMVCGGTLISTQWVLTAAHCLDDSVFLGPLTLRVGEYHRLKKEDSEIDVKRSTVFIHPNYDPSMVDYDVALIRLPSAVPQSDYISSACLPAHRSPLPKPGTSCVVTGWGKTSTRDHLGAIILNEAAVPIAKDDECRYIYDYHFNPKTMFCAGYKNQTIDTCVGDSGGPLLCLHEERWTIYGITSFGDKCGRKGVYGIYSRVPAFVSWVVSVMEQN